jgi:hypothetical protein
MDFLPEPGERAFGEMEQIARFSRSHGSGELVRMPSPALQETPRIFTGTIGQEQSGALPMTAG